MSDLSVTKASALEKLNVRNLFLLQRNEKKNSTNLVPKLILTDGQELGEANSNREGVKVANICKSQFG